MKGAFLLWKKNYISEHVKTCFYIDGTNKTYGVYINIKDEDRAEEIMKHFKKTKKEQIEAWQQEWKVGVA